MSHSKLLVVSPPVLQRAREMRHPLTPAEARVWARVRNNQLGYKIRRQHPIYRFIADFYCNEVKLCIEIDGDTHAAPEQVEYDTARTAWLEERDYKVVRFTNDDVFRHIDTVVEEIRLACVERIQES